MYPYFVIHWLSYSIFGMPYMTSFLKMEIYLSIAQIVNFFSSINKEIF